MNFKFNHDIGRMLLVLAASTVAVAGSAAGPTPAASAASTVATVPGMPAVVDPRNLYSETSATRVSTLISGDLKRIYVPNLRSNDVSVIDPETLKVVDRF